MASDEIKPTPPGAGSFSRTREKAGMRVGGAPSPSPSLSPSTQPRPFPAGGRGSSAGRSGVATLWFSAGPMLAVLGIVTDRDITVRGVAQGLDPDATAVSDIMTGEVEFATADQDTAEVMRVMGEKQIRRMPVVDQDRRLVGIVSIADLALRQPGHIDSTVREISEPGADTGNLR